MRQIVKILYNNRAYYSLYTAVSLSLSDFKKGAEATTTATATRTTIN